MRNTCNFWHFLKKTDLFCNIKVNNAALLRKSKLVKQKSKQQFFYRQITASHEKFQNYFLQIANLTDFQQISAIYQQKKMDRDEPPPMTNDVKKDIFGDDEDDDDLFKSAIADKVDKIDGLVGGSEITGNLLSSVDLGDENSNKVDK